MDGATPPTDSEMHIDASLDPERIGAIVGVIIDAVDGWSKANGGTSTADEVTEALCCNLCSIMQQAPNDVARAALANRAIEFIMRNCRVEPSVVLAFRVWRRANGLAGVKVEGSA